MTRMTSLIIQVDSLRLAVPLARVLEVLPVALEPRLPMWSPALAGVLRLRGGVVSVFDLHWLVTGEPARTKMSQRIVLVSRAAAESTPGGDFGAGNLGAGSSGTGTLGTGPSIAGLLVDRVHELLAVEADAAVEAPAAPGRLPLAGLLTGQSGLLGLLDLDALLQGQTMPSLVRLSAREFPAQHEEAAVDLLH